jgi:hypothetical protein
MMRFATPLAFGVLRRSPIRHAVRAAVIQTLQDAATGLPLVNGRRQIADFHRWGAEVLGDLRLFDGRMVDFDTEREEAIRVMVETLRVSGEPSPMLPIVPAKVQTRDLQTVVLSCPDTRLAITLCIRASDTPEAQCQVRFTPFVRRTAPWDGPGTKPYPRTMVECAAAECTVTPDEARSLLKTVADRTDILLFRTGSAHEREGELLDEIVVSTRAVMVHIVDDEGVATDAGKVCALAGLRRGDNPGVILSPDDDWVGIFFEIESRTYLGGVVLRMAAEHAMEAEWASWEHTSQLHTSDLARDYVGLSDLDCLSTFTKLYIRGGFREL